MAAFWRMDSAGNNGLIRERLNLRPTIYKRIPKDEVFVSL